MASFSRGYKKVVMTKSEWQQHPLKALCLGNDGKYKPGLSDGVNPWIDVIFKDVSP
jgi:hypothetical protein